MTATILADRPDLPSGSVLGRLVRTGLALGLACAITAGLFLLMGALIWVEDPAPPVIQETPPFVIAEIPDEIEAAPRTPPTQVVAVDPPPMRTRLPIDPSDNPGASVINTTPPGVAVEIDSDLIGAVPAPPPPLTVRVPPVYPRREQARGVEGRCTVQYDILANGRTANARTLGCDSVGFERASLAAVDQWRHAIATGRPGDEVVRQGVRTTLEFRLEQ